MEYGGVEDGFHAAEHCVECCDEHEAHCRNPEEIDAPKLVDAEHLLEHKAAGVHRHGHFGEHIADERYGGKNGARLRVESFLKKFGHGVYHGARIERDEYPSEDKNHPALYFPMCHGHAARCAGAGKADEVLRTDVGCENRGADGYPRGVFAAEKIVGRVVLFLAHYPYDNSYQGNEKQGDDNPVK